MREILFRGKRVDNGEWVYGYYTCAYGIHTIEFATPSHDNCHFHQHDVVPTTIGQFTGLTDRNGAKIFEGDVYIFTNDDGTETKPCQVGFDLGRFAGIIRLGKGGHDTLTIDYLHCKERVEIIGNIHDNPELVGGRND